MGSPTLWAPHTPVTQGRCQPDTRPAPDGSMRGRLTGRIVPWPGGALGPDGHIQRRDVTPECSEINRHEIDNDTIADSSIDGRIK